MKRRIIVITPEYPPDIGGVADYSQMIANGLSEVAEVEVWASGSSGRAREGSVTVFRELRRFGIRDLMKLRLASGDCIFLQWAPHGFKLKGLNLPLSLWIHFLALGGYRLEVVVHEPYLPASGGFRRLIASIAQRLMFFLVTAKAKRIWVTTTAWEPLLPRHRDKKSVEWVPVPALIPTSASARVVKSSTRRVGHFSLYSSSILQTLEVFVPALLLARPDVEFMFVGKRGAEVRDRIARGRARDLAERMRASASGESQSIANDIASCDCLVQPFPGGVSTRNSGVMAGLALGVPVVTTVGPLTDPIWEQLGCLQIVNWSQPDDWAPAVSGLLDDEKTLRDLAERSQSAYIEYFSEEHLLSRLRDKVGLD